jgi:hypothetical protein
VSAWPDLMVAGLMSGLFLSSSFQILRQSFQESRGTADPHAGHHHD